MIRGRRANFAVVGADAEQIHIKDLGPWDEHRTVTNDAESVVEVLVRCGILRPGARLFYTDSQGELDELLVADGKFAGFASGPPMPEPAESPAISSPFPWSEPARARDGFNGMIVAQVETTAAMEKLNAALEQTMAGQCARVGRALWEVIAKVAALLHVAAVLEWLSRALGRKVRP